MTEAQLVTKIINQLYKYFERSLWIKIHGGPFQMSGLPDIIGVYKGRFYGFEVKLPGKEATLTKIQIHMLNSIQSCGGISKMITSSEDAILTIKNNI